MAAENKIKVHYRINQEKFFDFKKDCENDLIKLPKKLRTLLINFLSEYKEKPGANIEYPNYPSDDDKYLFLDQDLLTEIDFYIKKYNDLHKFFEISRADIVKKVIYDYIK